jgi:hypothetical protein
MAPSGRDARDAKDVTSQRTQVRVCLLVADHVGVVEVCEKWVQWKAAVVPPHAAAAATAATTDGRATPGVEGIKSPRTTANAICTCTHVVSAAARARTVNAAAAQQSPVLQARDCGEIPPHGRRPPQRDAMAHRKAAVRKLYTRYSHNDASGCRGSNLANTRTHETGQPRQSRVSGR